MKVDDDCFFNLERLQSIIYSQKSKEELLLGHAWAKARPITNIKTFGTKRGRWLVPSYMYDKKFFPQYMAGPGYVMSRKAAQCILEVIFYVKL